MIILFTLLLVTTVAQYDPTIAKGLCQLTVASYCNPARLADWSCIPCKNAPLQLANVKLFKNSTGDTLGFIATSTQLRSIVLVFRGTLPWDIKNWITDIDFIPVDYPLCGNKCKVHKGFFDSYMQIHSQIMSSITDYEKRFGFKNYVVTGHSLGAAISTHAAAYLTSLGKNIIYFYNFGSPRVGTPAFASWFETYFKGSFKARITHRKDPVPHLPLEAMDFRHIKTQIFYEGNVAKGYKVCKQAQDRTCSDKYLNDTDVLDHLTYMDFDYTGIVLACQV